MEHYFTNNNNLKSNKKLISFKFKDKEYKFYTDNGVFSKDSVDVGTTVLLSALPFDNIKGKVLDFGCGYGPLGIIIASNTNSEIDMCDINERAISLSNQNIELNNIKNAKTIISDMYQNINKKYDYIISNPPIRIGKNNLYKILTLAKDYLTKDGQLIIVINKHQGAKSLIKDMGQYYNINVILKKHDFFVLNLKNELTN